MKKLMMICMVLLFVSSVASAADWTPFIIRNANTTGEVPTYSLDGGVLTVDVDSTTGGQKVGYGTSYLEGQRLDSLARFQVIRLDEHPNVYAPYINIWVTDGIHYAVLSLEPSHYPEFDWTHDLYAADYLSISPWVYETNLSDVSWIKEGAYLGGNGHYLYGSDNNLLTIADIGHLTIKAPSAEELATGLPGVGTGAPRELGTNIAYGFNLVFGDTQSNYIGGYQIEADPTLIGGIPNTLWVDDDYCEGCGNDGHIWGYDAFDNIPDAVDAVQDGGAIKVQAGNYAEQVDIRDLGDLSIEGDMATISVPEGGMTGSLVKIVNCEGIQFSGFTVDGQGGEGVVPGSANEGGDADTRFYGIFAINSSGEINNNTVQNVSWHNGVQQGIGVYAYVTDGIARDMDFCENTITNFQKGGLVVRGPIKSKISKNTITHWGETGIIAGNGIQIDGGTSLIISNIVSDSQYYDEEHPDWYAAGILLMAYVESADNFRIVRNSISNSDVGIAVVDYGAGITDITIVNNTFADNLWDTVYSQDGKIDIKEHANKYE